jgi:hypothetical protein
MELANVLCGCNHWTGTFIAAEEATGVVPEGLGRKMNTMMLAAWVHWEAILDQQ